ncbi:hypothetical protein QAD02_019304 [Eretmocerus hayati]|uniref:Uncharacterized protein n=1 Tax=Eretmocerus hayati TaxID=131215 RepID=A0ACC2PJH1_9HYME|nr:hypothetical protein QAD02_019304 [Eretmocerus hayati]
MKTIIFSAALVAVVLAAPPLPELPHHLPDHLQVDKVSTTPITIVEQSLIQGPNETRWSFKQSNDHAEEHRRYTVPKEVVDKDGKVQTIYEVHAEGSISYLDQNGKVIQVKYYANPEKGYQAEGAHLPQVVPVADEAVLSPQA